MRRVANLPAVVVASAVWSATPASAEPVPPPPPAPPPGLVGIDPAQFLAPLERAAPITLLNPDSYRMPAGTSPSPYVLAEGGPPGPFATIDELKGLHAMLHGALGRMPGAELGVALPGTAPPPGTSLPPGLEQFLPPPPAGRPDEPPPETTVLPPPPG